MYSFEKSAMLNIVSFLQEILGHGEFTHFQIFEFSASKNDVKDNTSISHRLEPRGVPVGVKLNFIIRIVSKYSNIEFAA